MAEEEIYYSKLKHIMWELNSMLQQTYRDPLALVSSEN
jgi:hypothetical protein